MACSYNTIQFYVVLGRLARQSIEQDPRYNFKVPRYHGACMLITVRLENLIALYSIEKTHIPDKQFIQFIHSSQVRTLFSQKLSSNIIPINYHTHQRTEYTFTSLSSPPPTPSPVEHHQSPSPAPSPPTAQPPKQPPKQPQSTPQSGPTTAGRNSTETDPRSDPRAQAAHHASTPRPH